MTRSRLRRPTSKSTTTTLSPFCARAAPSAADDVVLPTPPLPDVTTITLPIDLSCDCRGDCVSAQHVHLERIPLKPDLHRLAMRLRLQVFRRLVETVDGDQFGLKLAAEDARGWVAHRSGQSAPAQ